MSRMIVSSFWKEHASATLPGNVSSRKPTIRSGSHVSTSAGSCKKYLIQRVAAETQAKRLERDDLVRRDVAEVHRRPELLDEPGLSSLRRRLEDHVLDTDGVGDLADQLGAHAAGRVEDARGAAFARFGDDLPRARVQLFAQPLDPLGRGVLDRGVLRADLGQDGEVALEVRNQLELALER